ncbi:hypothetical protein ACHAPI_010134 [Fusarium lateritium]
MSSRHSFTPLTSPADVAAAFPESIQGKTILVTGVSPNSLGFATAAALASQKPARLILSGRSSEKVQVAIDILKTDYGHPKYNTLIMDLSSQAPVRAAASQIINDDDIPAIDILINNAGVMAIPTLTLSEDGIETAFATNHVGHFLFTVSLNQKLAAKYGIASYAVHPGAVDTGINRHADPKEVEVAVARVKGTRPQFCTQDA